MFPDRFWAALRSGEASNERVTGDVWPRKDVRDARLLECVDVIRRLLAVHNLGGDDAMVPLELGELAAEGSVLRDVLNGRPEQPLDPSGRVALRVDGHADA